MLKLTSQLSIVEGENNGRFPFAHSIYIDDEVRALIDAGAGRRPLEPLAAGGVDRVILSHFHHDHTRYSYLFSTADFYIHPLDAPAVESWEQFLGCSGLGRLEEQSVPLSFTGGRPVAVKVSGPLEEGQLLSFGRQSLRVLHTPGHTPGHCAFADEQSGLVLLMDIDLSSFGPWYGNPGSDIDQFSSSIERIAGLQPDIAVTSHQGVVRGSIARRLQSYLDVIERRDAKIIRRLQKAPGTLEEITGDALIYGCFPEPAAIYRQFERVMLQKHLERLRRRGVVSCQQGVYVWGS